MARKMKRISLALQGGGAHGAYTWGVLDRLLEEEDIEIAAISGTSAGAMNGAALKAGWCRGGREGAREELSRFWQQMGAMDEHGLWSWFFSALPLPGARDVRQVMDYTMAGSVADMLSVVTTPYALGPFYKNPLRPIIEKLDFDAVCSREGPELFVCATRVSDGRARIFGGGEVTTDALLASACLPNLFCAVEMDDPQTGQHEAFWDGGYSGNPALFPLYPSVYPEDVLIVGINPMQRKDTPMLPQEIQNRINEISFNASLIRELRAIALVQRLFADEEAQDDGRHDVTAFDFIQKLLFEGREPANERRNLRLHLITDDKIMNDLGSTTKMFPNPLVMRDLRDAGRASAECFLTAHGNDLGACQTLDLKEMFG